MKNIWTHVYIALAVFVALFVVGSFYDYQLNQLLFHSKDTFGLVVSTIGTIPGYGIAAFIGGGCIFLAIKKNYQLVYKILLGALGVVAFGISVYFSGREFFGPNGFDYLNINEWWGLLIALPVDAAIAFLGYYLTSKSKNDRLWILYVALAAAMLLALVAGTTVIKSIFHRPRYRSIYLFESEGLYFHEWWEACKDYKDLMKQFGLVSEEFKSFPSGHASCCSVFMMAAPFIVHLDKKYEKLEIPLFYIGFAWTLFISFARLYVGAHFLSDVSMGSMLPILFFSIARIVYKKFDKPSELLEKAEEVKTIE